MLNFVLMLFRFLRSLFRSIKEPEFKALFVFVSVLLISGTLFYHHVEGWSVLDSLYFSVITLATVGFGDFTPVTSIGKIFTIIYILVGVGTLLSFVTIIAKNARRKN